MPTFIQKLALAFLEYKKKLKDQECSSGASSPAPSMPCCSDCTHSQPCSDGSDGLTPHSLLPLPAGELDQGSLAAYLRWLRVQRLSAKFGKGLDSAMLLLRVEHWLEAGDEKHRHGSNLKPYFSVFLDSQRTTTTTTTANNNNNNQAPATDELRANASPSSARATADEPRASTSASASRVPVDERCVSPARHGTLLKEAEVLTPQQQQRLPAPGSNFSPVDGLRLSGPGMKPLAAALSSPATLPVSAAGTGAPVVPVLLVPGSQGPSLSRGGSIAAAAAAASAANGDTGASTRQQGAASLLTPMPVVVPGKGEPPGGWQQVLEAVAASAYRRSGSGSLRLARHSCTPHESSRGDGRTRSRTLSRYSTCSLQDRSISSAPVTPGISRRPSMMTAHVSLGGAAAGDARGRPAGSSGAVSTTCAVSGVLPHGSGGFPGGPDSNPGSEPLASCSLSPSPLGPRSLPVTAYSCHQLSRLVEEHPWCEEGEGQQAQQARRSHRRQRAGGSRSESGNLTTCRSVRTSSDGSLSDSPDGGSDDASASTCGPGKREGSCGEGGSSCRAAGHGGLGWLDSDSDDSSGHDSGGEQDAASFSTDDGSMCELANEDMARCDFFAWLDHGAGKHLDLAHVGVSREKLERERVRYLSADELPHYEVVVDRDTGRLKFQVSGQLLHTFPTPGPSPRRSCDLQTQRQDTQRQEVQPLVGGDRPPALAPDAPGPGAIGAAAAAAAGAGPGTGAGAGAPLAAGAQPDGKKWIWVAAPSGRLYVAQKVRGQFHHSSFLRGAAVLAAGNLMARHGQLVKLTADSGHYWPQPDHFRWFYEHLRQQGADMAGLQGITFHTKH